MAEQRESNFFFDHPALVATVLTLGILAAFLGAIYNSAKGHGGGHDPAHAGSAHPSGAPAAAGGSSKPASGH